MKKQIIVGLIALQFCTVFIAIVRIRDLEVEAKDALRTAEASQATAIESQKLCAESQEQCRAEFVPMTLGEKLSK